MEIFLYAFLLFFAVIGICDIIHCIHMHFIMPKKRIKKIAVCKFDKNHIDSQLNYLMEQYKWYGPKYFDSFICLCDESVLKLAQNCPYKEFCFIDSKDIMKLCEMFGSEK